VELLCEPPAAVPVALLEVTSVETAGPTDVVEDPVGGVLTDSAGDEVVAGETGGVVGLLATLEAVGSSIGFSEPVPIGDCTAGSAPSGEPPLQPTEKQQPIDSKAATATRLVIRGRVAPSCVESVIAGYTRCKGKLDVREHGAKH
jgi:hypothetical protein